MLSSILLSISLFVLYAVAAIQGNNKPVPGCVQKCWVNTQYVSMCGGDDRCLCDDTEFQNAVYQCLYSQCQTAHFASALHHTLAMCSPHALHSGSDAVPALVRQQEGMMVKRDMPMGSISASNMNSASVMRSGSVTRSGSVMRSASVMRSGSVTRSGSVMRSATQSAGRSVTRSGSVMRPTQSVTRGMQSVSASAYNTFMTSRAMPKAPLASQISDGQVQAPTAIAVTQISDGQIQAPTSIAMSG